MSNSNPGGFLCISAAEALTLINTETTLALFDVRDVASYQRAHLADAMHLSEDRLPVWFRRLPKEQAIVIYCYHGNASKTYAQMFADFRFARVFSVDGGYEALAGVKA